MYSGTDAAQRWQSGDGGPTSIFSSLDPTQQRDSRTSDAVSTISLCSWFSRLMDEFLRGVSEVQWAISGLLG